VIGAIYMSKKDAKMAEKFKELSVLENDYAVKLDTEVRGYGNEIFRDIIGSIAVDSKKHSGLFKACAAICNGDSLSLTEDEYNGLVNSLKKHEAVEGNMIKTVDDLLAKIKDDRIRMMLNHIKGDEVRHHLLINNLTKMVAKREVILEKDVWNQLFKDVLTHGHAPPDQFEEPE
jgi:rubrerythrin